MRSRSDRSGFTIIELMIVVVIIGILAAIAIPNFIALQNRAKDGSTKANMESVALALEDFSVQNNGVYPISPGQVTPLLSPAAKNPFTSKPLEIVFRPTMPAANARFSPGTIVIRSDSTSYEVYGVRWNGTLIENPVTSGS